MNEKLNIQDLSVILAKQRGLEKEKAENFVREFFALIGEALETDNTQNKADIQTNEENIAALAAATTAWGSF